MLNRLRSCALAGLAALSVTGCNRVTVVSHTQEPVLVIIGRPAALPPVPEPPPPPPPPPPPKAAITEDAIRLDAPVEFEGKTAQLDPASDAVLDEVANLLADNPRLERVSIEAHTDGEGPSGENKTLSKQQASTVRDYLIEKGIDAKRLKIKALGESRPLNTDGTEEAAAQNRRIEILILDQQPETEPAAATEEAG